MRDTLRRVADDQNAWTVDGFPLTTMSLQLERMIEREAQFLQVDRLADEVVGAASQSRDSILEQRLGRNHNHGRPRAAALDLGQQVEAGAVWQIDVEQQRGGPLCNKGRQRRRSRLGFDRLVIPTAQSLAKRPPNRRLVVYD